MSHEHIPTETILNDIAETQAEIAKMNQEAEAWEHLPHTLEHKWDHMRASARRQGIIERQVFIEKLRGILAERGVV